MFFELGPTLFCLSAGGSAGGPAADHRVGQGLGIRDRIRALVEQLVPLVLGRVEPADGDRDRRALLGATIVKEGEVLLEVEAPVSAFAETEHAAPRIRQADVHPLLPQKRVKSISALRGVALVKPGLRPVSDIVRLVHFAESRIATGPRNLVVQQQSPEQWCIPLLCRLLQARDFAFVGPLGQVRADSRVINARSVGWAFDKDRATVDRGGEEDIRAALRDGHPHDVVRQPGQEVDLETGVGGPGVQKKGAALAAAMAVEMRPRSHFRRVGYENQRHRLADRRLSSLDLRSATFRADRVLLHERQLVALEICVVRHRKPPCVAFFDPVPVTTSSTFDGHIRSRFNPPPTGPCRDDRKLLFEAVEALTQESGRCQPFFYF